MEVLGLFIRKAGLTERGIAEADSGMLTAMVEFVSKNMRKFTGEKDIGILRLLKTCVRIKGLRFRRSKCAAQ